MRKCLALALCLWLAGAVCLAQEAAPAGLEQQIATWEAQEEKLDAELDAIEDRVKASAEVVALRKARDTAQEAYDRKKRTDRAYADALDAEEEAEDALDRLVAARIAGKPEGKALLDELAAVEDRQRQLRYDRQLIELALTHDDSPVNRAIDKDPEIQTLEAAYETASNAYARDRTLKPRRDAARQALRDARKAKMGVLPEGKKLLEQLDALRKERAQLEDKEDELDDKLDDMEDAIEESNDPEIKAALARVEATEEARKQAYNGEELAAARQARDAARTAYEGKVKALLAADPKAPQLRQDRDALRERIHQAKRQLREEKKGKE